ncbi:MAG TPA: PQQ-binding-like beta-propeller repeat protein [Egicoccus sp.]|nr:PQQ-binding-like beta-propeller repeat protein [Egicoccus sp.]HSK21666.1 PQQ-binding-like beta-propeller repeat protein [Egicoccus sp.]
MPTTGVRVAASKAIGGGLLVVADGRSVVATDAATGASVFELDLDDLGLSHAGERAVSLRPYDGGVVLASGPTTTALARGGAQRWRLTSDGVLATRIVVADRERIVLVGSHRDGTDRLQVVRTTDGGLRFARPIAALVTVEEQTALVREAGQDGGVTAVSLLDGTVRWASLSSSDVVDDG